MNRHYNLNLTCKAATKNEEIVFDFDPYNDCSDFADLRELAAAELGGEIDPEDIEVEIVDFGDVPEKWANKSDVFEFAAALYECEQSIEVVEAALELGISPNHIDEAYCGEYASDEDFAADMADQLGYINNEVTWPYTCIDWEQAAKELMYDYYAQNGHYFWAF